MVCDLVVGEDGLVDAPVSIRSLACPTHTEVATVL